MHLAEKEQATALAQDLARDLKAERAKVKLLRDALNNVRECPHCETCKDLAANILSLAERKRS